MNRRNLILDVVITAAIAALLLLLFATTKSTAKAVALYMRRSAEFVFSVVLIVALGKVADRYKLGIYFFIAGSALILLFMVVLSSGF